MSSLTNSLGYAETGGVPVQGVTPSVPGPRIGFNGLVVIGSISLALAVATAIECQSVTHMPSLMYGMVLWAWWGFIAGTIWWLGPRRPGILRFSPVGIGLHLLGSCGLGVSHLLLLGSLGFTVAEWHQHATALAVWTSLLSLNRFGMEILIYWFVFGVTGGAWGAGLL